MVDRGNHNRTHSRIRDHRNPTLPRPRLHLLQASKTGHSQNRKPNQQPDLKSRRTRLLRMVPQPIHDTPHMDDNSESLPHPLWPQMAHRMGRSHSNSRILPTSSRKQNLMYNTPRKHVVTILYLFKEPITQEHLTSIASTLGYPDTPQSLRSRMVELEREGYVHRVDRNGISARKRPCWRWQLTKKGQEYMQELLDLTTPDERK